MRKTYAKVEKGWPCPRKYSPSRAAAPTGNPWGTDRYASPSFHGPDTQKLTATTHSGGHKQSAREALDVTGRHKFSLPYRCTKANMESRQEKLHAEMMLPSTRTLCTEIHIHQALGLFIFIWFDLVLDLLPFLEEKEKQFKKTN